MAIKRATISDYNGRSLNSNEGSSIEINPRNVRRFQQLKKWYQMIDKSDIVSLNQKEAADCEQVYIPG